MKSGHIATISLAVALVAAGLCAVVFMNKKEAVARAEQAKAESRESAAKEAARKAASDDAAARAKESAAKESAKAAEENRKAKEAERETAKAEAEKARLAKEAAVANRAAREAEAQAASDAKAAERAKADAAKAEVEKAAKEVEKASLDAQAAADALAREKLRSEAVIAEAKLWELKQNDLASLERDLMEFKRELDEREASLRPEKTIMDLVNIAPEASDDNADEAAARLPENDMSLPRGERALAKAQRISSESRDADYARNRKYATAALERLYVAALKEDRVTDAQFYRKTLKSLYPDWEYKAPQQEEQEAKE